MGSIPRLKAGTDAQNVIQCALGDEGALALGIGNNHTQALAHEVVGDFFHFLLGADIQPGLLCGSLNRFIQRVVQPGLVVRIEISVGQNSLGWLPLRIEGAVEANHTFRECAGLVGAQHVHAAEVLDGGQAAHDHAAPGHLLCTMGEGDTDNSRQKLGRQAYRQRQRKEKRV